MPLRSPCLGSRPAWASQRTLDAPVEGAKKEAKLVLYTAMQPEDSTKLIDIFKSRYPFIDATFFRAGSAPLLTASSQKLAPIGFFSIWYQEKIPIYCCCRKRLSWG